MDPISYSSIDFGYRSRTDHPDLDELADAIEDTGLIQPISLVLKTPELIAGIEKELNCTLDSTKPYLLVAGGRRYQALGMLETETLYYASSGEPERPGYVLSNLTSALDYFIQESQENLNRCDMDWRDQMRLIHRIAKMAEREYHSKGMMISQAMLGSTLGVKRADLEITYKVYEDFSANPKAYEDCKSMRAALSVALSRAAKTLSKYTVAQQLLIRGAALKGDNLLSEPTSVSPAIPRELAPLETEEDPIRPKIISVSTELLHTSAYDYLRNSPPGFTDHIICDPDYALDLAVLDSNPNNRPGLIGEGIAQADAGASLSELLQLFPLAYRAITDQGFFILWYALDHHEKLLRAAVNSGFAVQSWPLIWRKLGAKGQSNAAASYNFPKSTEFALVCRKKGTPLTKPQLTNVYECDPSDTTKTFGHPYAKPLELWRWIYGAVTIPGQRTYDPFAGSCSSLVAATQCGLRILGTEVQEDLYALGTLNLQSNYRKLYGSNVQFQ